MVEKLLNLSEFTILIERKFILDTQKCLCLYHYQSYENYDKACETRES